MLVREIYKLFLFSNFAERVGLGGGDNQGPGRNGTPAGCFYAYCIGIKTFWFVLNTVQCV